MTTPNFTLLSDYGMQYGLVQYEDGSYGVCNVCHYNPPGNTNPNVPFTGITLPMNPGQPSQEGSKVEWYTKSNNILPYTYATIDETLTNLHEALGGLQQLGVDVDTPENNPFRGQFTKSDFPDDPRYWPPS